MVGQQGEGKPDGLLVLDKPGGFTSRAALDRASFWFPPGTRIGHTGTLDPLATGMLVLCLGRATRLAEYVQRMAKTYRCTMRLGARSTTDDADGTITAPVEVAPPRAEAVTEALAGLVGKQEQVPPNFSAAKVSGRRAYDLSRTGRGVTLAARLVEIYSIDVLTYAYPFLDVEVRCGKGTYIRSLARDLGERLGCGALVQTLRRTSVGPFDEAKAVTLDATVELVRDRILPCAAAVVELPRVMLQAADVERLHCGQAVTIDQEIEAAASAAVFDATGRLAAVVKVDASRRLLLPEKVFSSPSNEDPVMIRFEGDRDFTQSPDEVWAKLTDPRLLVACIPDVQTVKSVSADHAELVLRPGLSFARGTLDIDLKVVDAVAPSSARMVILGKGIGSSSHVEATLAFAPQGTGTRVHWVAEIKELGGLLKMVPGGLIRGAAEKVVNDAWTAVVARFAAPAS
jgi:tRNA pseudouridine55 synthase